MISSQHINVVKRFFPSERQTEQCQPGWEHFQSSCYDIGSHGSLDQRTWEGARDDCVGKDADLVVIKSSEEQVRSGTPTHVCKCQSCPRYTHRYISKTSS